MYKHKKYQNFDTKLNNQAGAKILADERLTIKQTANVVASKLLTVINAGLLASIFKVISLADM
jgi:hypothetical protein